MDEDDQKQPEDPEETEATVLPAREAMSIITQDSAEESVSADDQSEQASRDETATSTT